MNEYLLSIVGVILLAAILTGILPNGKTAGLIKSVMHMVCILTIISPIVSFFFAGVTSGSGVKKSTSFFSQFVIETDATFIHYNSEMRIAEAERALETEISEQFSMNVSVALGWEMESKEIGRNEVSNLIKITQILVKMQEGQDEEKIKHMWEYLTKNYCSEVLIE